MNFKKEKKKTFHIKYNNEPLELEQLLYSIFNQQKYRYKINISLILHLLKKIVSSMRKKKKYMNINLNVMVHQQTPDYLTIHKP